MPEGNEIEFDLSPGHQHHRRRRWKLALACVGVLAATGVTWALALQARTPQQLAAKASPPVPSVITVPVEFEQLAQTTTLSCTASPKLSVPVPVVAGNSEISSIVTSLPLKAGRKIAEGEVAEEISGRPVIILRGRLPMYRQMAAGATGPDVDQLRAALARMGLLHGSKNGSFDAPARRALWQLYRDAGYSAPGSSPAESAGRPKSGDRFAGILALPGELLPVASLPARLGVVNARVGSVAKSGGIVIQGISTALTCTIPDPTIVQGLKRGSQVSILTPKGSSVSGTVGTVQAAVAGGQSTVGGSQQDSPDQGSGTQPQESQVQIQPGKELAVGSGYQAQVTLQAAPDSGPVVPITALWSEAGRHTIVKVIRGSRQMVLNVQPGFEAAGQIEVTGALEPGDRVIVSGDNTSYGAS